MELVFKISAKMSTLWFREEKVMVFLVRSVSPESGLIFWRVLVTRTKYFLGARFFGIVR